MEWIIDNWQFLVGDILVPCITFVLGIVVGKTTEKRKAKSTIYGNGNRVYQNCNEVTESENKSAKQK